MFRTDYFSGIAVENYNRHGAVGPSLFAVRLGGATLLESVVEMDDLMRALQASDEMRAKFAPVVQALLDEGGVIRADFRRKGLPLPDLAVHIVESLAASAACAAGGDMQEVVTIGLHTAAGTVLGHCLIEGSAPRQARPGTLDPVAGRRGAASLFPDTGSATGLH